MTVFHNLCRDYHENTARVKKFSNNVKQCSKKREYIFKRVSKESRNGVETRW